MSEEAFFPIITLILGIIMLLNTVVVGRGTYSMETTAALMVMYTSIISGMIFIIGFSLHAIRNREYSFPKKVICVPVLFCFNAFSFPFYYFMNIRER